jgi:hypothetical protein
VSGLLSHLTISPSPSHLLVADSHHPQPPIYQLPNLPALCYNPQATDSLARRTPRVLPSARQTNPDLWSARFARGEGTAHGIHILHLNPPALKPRRGGFSLFLWSLRQLGCAPAVGDPVTLRKESPNHAHTRLAIKASCRTILKMRSWRLKWSSWSEGRPGVEGIRWIMGTEVDLTRTEGRLPRQLAEVDGRER